jgi:hypothetical protein
MARTKIYRDSVLLWVSVNDTEEWATKQGAAWPCSTLRGSRFFVAFDTNGLVDYTINGKQVWNSGQYFAGEIDGNEFSAICADMLRPKLDKSHPCYFVTVGQFEG